MSRLFTTVVFVFALILAGPGSASITLAHAQSTDSHHVDGIGGVDHPDEKHVPHCATAVTCGFSVVMQKTPILFLVSVELAPAWLRHNDRAALPTPVESDPPVPRHLI